MTRPLILLAVMLAAPAVSQAQQAICDCCMVPYTVPGASWIGTSRGYGGLCQDCRLKCVNCKEQAEDLRIQYETFRRMRNRGGLAPTTRNRLDWLIDRMAQRWSDLRFVCLSSGAGDIGPIAAGAPEPPPSRGLNTPETKERLRKGIKNIENEVARTGFIGQRTLYDYVTSPTDRQAVDTAIETSRTIARAYDLAKRLADDPPDPDFDVVVKPEILPEQKDDGSPRHVIAGRRAIVAQRNANAYFDAYITSFERYQAAQKADRKDAMRKQVEAMGRFSHLAEKESRTAATQLREYERLRLKQIEAERAEQATKGIKWQDRLKDAQSKLRDGWPPEVVKAFDAAKVPDNDREEMRKQLLGLTPEAIEKSLADLRAQIELNEQIAAELAKTKAKTRVTWPEPQHIEAILLMQQQAHMLHAELAGRKRQLPKDNPFPEPKRGAKK